MLVKTASEKWNHSAWVGVTQDNILVKPLTGYNEGMAENIARANPWRLLGTRNVSLPVPLALFRPSDLSFHICVKSDAKATCRTCCIARDLLHYQYIILVTVVNRFPRMSLECFVRLLECCENAMGWCCYFVQKLSWKSHTICIQHLAFPGVHSFPINFVRVPLAVITSQFIKAGRADALGGATHWASF